MRKSAEIIMHPAAAGNLIAATRIQTETGRVAIWDRECQRFALVSPDQLAEQYDRAIAENRLFAAGTHAIGGEHA